MNKLFRNLFSYYEFFAWSFLLFFLFLAVFSLLFQTDFFLISKEHLFYSMLLVFGSYLTLKIVFKKGFYSTLESEKYNRPGAHVTWFGIFFAVYAFFVFDFLSSLSLQRFITAPLFVFFLAIFIMFYIYVFFSKK